MVVCGESGSGKTESAKLLMRHLAYTTQGTCKTDVVLCDVCYQLIIFIKLIFFLFLQLFVGSKQHSQRRFFCDGSWQHGIVDRTTNFSCMLTVFEKKKIQVVHVD